MDEILATIRRIISEDEQSSASRRSVGTAGAELIGGAAGAPGEAAKAPSDAGDGDGDGVLELTDALNEDGSVRRLAPSGSSSAREDRFPEPPPTAAETPAPEPRRDPELRLDAGEPSPAPPVEALPAPPAEPSPAPSAAERHGPNDERLVSEATSLAATAAFARLASVPRDRREPPLVGDRPLDEVVSELLRPLLRTWLDENLPGIVERLVEAEIARARRSAAD